MRYSNLIYIESESGDWCGIYVDSELQVEGHSLPTSAWVDLINKFQFFKEASIYGVSDSYIESVGYLPKRFNDINNSELIKY